MNFPHDSAAFRHNHADYPRKRDCDVRNKKIASSAMIVNIANIIKPLTMTSSGGGHDARVRYANSSDSRW